MYGVEGSDAAYAAPGATTSTTVYDERQLPSEVTFRDAGDAVVCRVVFSRDEDGRVLSERAELAGPVFGPAMDARIPPDERRSFMELLKTAFGEHAFWLTTYAYDARGRRVGTVRRMGNLDEQRITVRYDDLNNPVEEVTSDVGREMRIDDGVVKSEERPTLVDHARYQYQYDAHGNWTERIIWQRIESHAEERRSNLERRTIVYYEFQS